MLKFDIWPVSLRVMAALFVIAVPLFLVNASVAWAINDPGLYNQGFEKYRTSQYTGITEPDLRRAGAEIRHYFNSGDEPLSVRTQVFSEEREIFNRREVVHMRDVKGLVRQVYLLAGASMAYILAVAIGGFAGIGWAFTGQLARFLLWGGLLTLGLLLLFGLFAAVGFDSLFLKFHQISFSNDFWQLDPSRDYLIIMFPLGFWFDATMRVAVTSVASAIGLTAVSGAYLLYGRWAIRKSAGGIASTGTV
jgi:integral membrane protein (TIGR01906 family)